MGNDPKNKAEKYVDGTIMSIYRPKKVVASVMRSLVERKSVKHIDRKSTEARTQHWWRLPQGN